MALPMTLFEGDDRSQLLTSWFGEYHVSLQRYLLRLLGDPERAADLLQDTFVRAMAVVRVDAPPDEPQAWLYRIATNLAYNALRRQRRRQWLPLGDTQHTASFEGGVAIADVVRRCLARLTAIATIIGP
jgi:RNA polymerase sigma-70 factor (ECF subfamily)